MRTREMEAILRDLSPRHAEFVREYMTNGQKVREAAEATGYKPQTGSILVTQHKKVKKAIAEIEALKKHEVAKGILEDLDDWTDMAKEAKRRLRDLLGSSDERVALNAAQTVLDRALGKAIQKVEGEHTHKHEGPEMDSLTLRAAMALVLARGWTLGQAVTYVRQHPDEVKNWNQLMAGQAEVQEAEVLDETLDSDSSE